MEAIKQIVKLLATVEKSDDGMIAVISTKVEDRDGDVLMPNGIKLENYEKNPVVLWGHDHSQPAIGKALWVKAGRNNVKAKIQWANTPLGQEVKTLYEDGIMSAFSVGFIPKRWEESRNDNGGFGYKFLEWELIEFSAVNVPSNPQALIQRSYEKSYDNNLRKELGVDIIETMELKKTIDSLVVRVEVLEASESKSVEVLGAKSEMPADDTDSEMDALCDYCKDYIGCVCGAVSAEDELCKLLKKKE